MNAVIFLKKQFRKMGQFRAIRDFFDTLLEQGDAVILRGFGSFHVRDKHARIGRNPKTGQEAAIPPRRVVRFQSGKFLKHAVNRSSSEALASQS